MSSPKNKKALKVLFCYRYQLDKAATLARAVCSFL
jgi:hypothetical protein